MLVEPAGARDARALGELLVDVVQGGASVGFLDGLTVDAAERWWQAHLARDGQRVLVARDGDDLLGTGTLVLSDMPNGRHRAELVKLLVSPRARRQGIGRLLLDALEAAAVQDGRRLLILDTVTDSPAQQLYEAAGWKVVGVVEDYATMPHGSLAPTTFMSRWLG